MRRVLAISLAVCAGLIAWIALATAGNFLLRALIADYSSVERAMAFTTPMLLARLVLAFVSTAVAGGVCALAARSDKVAGTALAVALLVVFVPMHAGLWDRFPIWYHIVFLASLAPLALLGYRLGAARRAVTT